MTKNPDESPRKTGNKVSVPDFPLPLAANVSSQWAAIHDEAPKYGNTVTIYPGANATHERFENALQTSGANVVFSGHANLDSSGATNGISFGDNHSVGIGINLDGTFPTGPDGLPQTMVTDQLNANSIALFGCNTLSLSGLFSGSTFTGTQPTTNTEAEDAGARAYTDTLVRKGTVDQATTAAATAMADVTSQANRNPDRPMTYHVTTVCSIGPAGGLVCKQGTQ